MEFVLLLKPIDEYEQDTRTLWAVGQQRIQT